MLFLLAMKKITHSDLQIIINAKQVLESESIAQRISQVASKPIQGLMGMLPDSAGKSIGKWVNISLEQATDWAMATTGSKEAPIFREDWMHKVTVGLSGFLGGVGGLASTLVELPVSTMLMLRSIGCIAETEGHDMASRKTRLSCVSILAMGADPEKTQNDELGYWMARKAMAGLVTQAAEWSGRGSVPALAKFVIEVGKKFGVAVSAKAAAQAAPFLGGVAGVAINEAFLDHYQSVAHAHFGMERLCLKYGEVAVKSAYARAE